MTQTMIGLLVGSYFRPPAKQLLAVLPSGSKLELRPDPQNPYDPNAMAVYFATSTLQQLPEKALASLEDSLPSCGWTIRLLQGQTEIQLGYLARAGNRDLGKLPHLLPARALAEAGQKEAILLGDPTAKRQSEFSRTQEGRMEFEIEDGVPLLRALSPGRSSKYPWAELNVAQSFFVPASVTTRKSMSSAAMHQAQRNGGKYATRTAEKDGVPGTRVWRIE